MADNENSKLDELRRTLAIGERQLDEGQGVDGEEFFSELFQYEA